MLESNGYNHPRRHHVAGHLVGPEPHVQMSETGSARPALAGSSSERVFLSRFTSSFRANDGVLWQEAGSAGGSKEC